MYTFTEASPGPPCPPWVYSCTAQPHLEHLDHLECTLLQNLDHLDHLCHLECTLVQNSHLDHLHHKHEGEGHGGEHQQHRAQGEEVGHNAGALLTGQTELAELSRERCWEKMAINNDIVCLDNIIIELWGYFVSIPVHICSPHLIVNLRRIPPGGSQFCYGYLFLPGLVVIGSICQKMLGRVFIRRHHGLKCEIFSMWFC